MQKIKGFFLLNLILALLSFSACVQSPNDQATKPADNSKPAADGKVKIGFAMATVKEERWQRDRDAFEAHCKKLNVDCELTFANNSAEKQLSDVDQLLTKGINVLVIAPQNATQAVQMVEKAKAKGIPVISYDRLINSDKIDVYISHQVPVIGRKIAEYALQKVPKGNYVMVYGSSTDNNAHIMKKEQLDVLQPAIDKKDITIVASQNINDWKPEEALKFAENTMTQNQGKIDAFVVSNDGMAGGVISALGDKAGKIIVTGQDAEKAALQRIAEGKQSMTVYKPIVPLAQAAVEAAIKLAKKETLTDAKPFTTKVEDKDLTVPAILLEVTVVDKDNLMTTVIKDGFVTFEDVYKNVPADQRPKQ
jgi:D-xylose transport system substrate-binding protein